MTSISLEFNYVIQRGGEGEGGVGGVYFRGETDFCASFITQTRQLIVSPISRYGTSDTSAVCENREW